MNNTQVRQNVFETNSSSTHAIALCDIEDDELKDYLDVDENGEIHVHAANYGEEGEKYTDAANKLSFVFATILANHYDESYFDNTIATLTKVVEEQTGGKLVLHSKRDKEEQDDNGDSTYDSDNYYVDESGEALYSYASLYASELQNEVILKAFIFNKASSFEYQYN